MEKLVWPTTTIKLESHQIQNPFMKLPPANTVDTIKIPVKQKEGIYLFEQNIEDLKCGIGPTLSTVKNNIAVVESYNFSNTDIIFEPKTHYQEKVVDKIERSKYKKEINDIDLNKVIRADHLNLEEKKELFKTL